MSNRIRCFALIAGIAIAAGTASSADDKEKPKLVPLDLAPGGVFLTIDAPAGTRVSSSVGIAVVHWGREEKGTLKVREMAPTETGDDIADAKKRFSGASVKVLLDTKDAFAAGYPILGDTFQCFVRKKIEDKQWLCVGENLTEDQALSAAQAAQSLRRTAANAEAEQVMHVAVKKLKELDCSLRSLYSTLALSGDQVQDPDLALLKHIPQIDWVSIEDASKLTPDGFRQALALPSLKSVTLQGENINDAWLEHLHTVKRLERIWLRETSLTANAWPHLGKVSGLKELKVRNTPIRDAALKHLTSLKALNEIELRGMALNDAGLEHLAEVKSLYLLDLRESHVDDAALAKLHNARQISIIRLGKTKVTQQGVAKLKAALPKAEVETE